MQKRIIALALSLPLTFFAAPAFADGNPTGGGWDPGQSLYQSDAELSDLNNKLADAN